MQELEGPYASLAVFSVPESKRKGLRPCAPIVSVSGEKHWPGGSPLSSEWQQGCPLSPNPSSLPSGNATLRSGPGPSYWVLSSSSASRACAEMLRLMADRVSQRHPASPTGRGKGERERVPLSELQFAFLLNFEGEGLGYKVHISIKKESQSMSLDSVWFGRWPLPRAGEGWLGHASPAYILLKVPHSFYLNCS